MRDGVDHTKEIQWSYYNSYIAVGCRQSSGGLLPGEVCILDSGGTEKRSEHISSHLHLKAVNLRNTFNRCHTSDIVCRKGYTMIML